MNQTIQKFTIYFQAQIKTQLLKILIRFLKLSGTSSVDRQIHNIKIANEAIQTNKLKSMLTALGIIFGVAAVISMLAIGRGAKHEILEQMKYVGVNNIIIEPIEKDTQAKTDIKSDDKNKSKSKGLTLNDLESLKNEIPSIKYASPEMEFNTFLIYNQMRKPVKLLGVDNSYFSIYDLKVNQGNYFNHLQEEFGLPVCIISSGIKTKFFKNADPVNQNIKCGLVWLKVIGVYEKKDVAKSKPEEIKISFDENYIYIPAKSMQLRYVNQSPKNNNGNKLNVKNFKESTLSINPRPLARVIVQVTEPEQIHNTATLIDRVMYRRHYEVRDFKVTVPELLIKQQQRTKNIFNFVLGAIAGISLLVGGIGIMNIMYASVLERIKEIGIRMALGATRQDIMTQFISEAILISIIGGILGVVLGIIISQLIMHLAGILTIISFLSIMLAFLVSVGVGVIFGFAPARKAAFKTPIELLRYE